ncbi:MAG: hypothetical protein ACRDQG_09255, partial [Pseudonocardiaceae bacterium]
MLNVPAPEQVRGAQTAMRGQQLIGTIKVEGAKHFLDFGAPALPADRLSKHDRGGQATPVIERKSAKLLSAIDVPHPQCVRRCIDDHVEVWRKVASYHELCQLYPGAHVEQPRLPLACLHLFPKMLCQHAVELPRAHHPSALDCHFTDDRVIQPRHKVRP